MTKYDFDTEHFRHRLQIQMRFSDFDAMNHVNNGFQCQYFDVGRLNYFSEALQRKVDWSSQFLVLVHTEFDFIRPVLAGEKIFVESKVTSFGKKSVKMFQRIVDDKGEVKSTCFSVLAGYDREKDCSLEVPEFYKEGFDAYDKDCR